jgi:membrane carboxypeptidase/penicillin-binding protein PbpC
MSVAALRGRPVVEPPARLVILSPQQDDHYRIPPGVEPRYVSIALRATGAGAPIRWYVDGRSVATARWMLRPGRHEIRAEAGNTRAAVNITVEGP